MDFSISVYESEYIVSSALGVRQKSAGCFSQNPIKVGILKCLKFSSQYATATKELRANLTTDFEELLQSLWLGVGGVNKILLKIKF
jgi:hypothetical protein